MPVFIFFNHRSILWAKQPWSWASSANEILLLAVISYTFGRAFTFATVDLFIIDVKLLIQNPPSHLKLHTILGNSFSQQGFKSVTRVWASGTLSDHAPSLSLLLQHKVQSHRVLGVQPQAIQLLASFFLNGLLSNEDGSLWNLRRNAPTSVCSILAQCLMTDVFLCGAAAVRYVVLYLTCDEGTDTAGKEQGSFNPVPVTAAPLISWLCDSPILASTYWKCHFYCKLLHLI